MVLFVCVHMLMNGKWDESRGYSSIYANGFRDLIFLHGDRDYFS